MTDKRPTPPKPIDFDHYSWRLLIVLLDGTEFSLPFKTEADALGRCADIVGKGYVSEQGEDVGPVTEGEEPERSNWTWIHPLHRVKRVEIQKRTR